MKRQHLMPFGAHLMDGAAHFRLWAPSAKQVALKYESPQGAWQRNLNETGNGWYELTAANVTAGTLYRYRIDDELDVPDPASRFNPNGVHGASELIDPLAFEWRDDDWQGRPWHEAVIYELHIGTFTRNGTFDALRARLKALAATGITAIELMPVAAFSGAHGWGYDGVLPFAPHAVYGRPETFKLLVQEAHACGLMVLLDVVYNHFGPDGNYLHRYANSFFTDRIATPWGSAIEFEGTTGRVVRDFFIHNALYWIEEYHLDGLRIDAVHAMHDRSPLHFIDELAQAIRHGPGSQRPVHVVLENHDNQSHRLRRDTQGRSIYATAQWNDDFHHALHVVLTGERDGYYVDFATQPLQQLGRALAEGFVYQGEASEFAGGKVRGEPSRDLPPTAFVNFLQTHDQIGNRALGERLSQLTSPEALRAGLAILLLAPQPPMLFMGEEFAAVQSFLYFCDYHDELGRAVTDGRRREFAQFDTFASADVRAAIPDPCDHRTLIASRLGWAMREKSPHCEVLQLVCVLLTLRTQHLWPLLPHFTPGAATYRISNEQELLVSWPINDGSQWMLQANLSSRTIGAATELRATLIGSNIDVAQSRRNALLPWEVRWMISPGPGVT